MMRFKLPEQAKEHLIPQAVKEYGHLDENDKFQLHGEFYAEMAAYGYTQEDYQSCIDKAKKERGNNGIDS